MYYMLDALLLGELPIVILQVIRRQEIFIEHVILASVTSLEG